MAQAKQSDKPVKETKAKKVSLAIADEPAEEKAEGTAKTAAKAGKRSTKAVKAAETKQAKDERKKPAPSETAPKDKAKQAQKPPRSREDRAGKKYREAAKQVDKSKTYNLAEAVDLAVRTSTTKFDATVEIHFNLAVDPKQADQNVLENVGIGTAANGGRDEHRDEHQAERDRYPPVQRCLGVGGGK